MAKRLITIEWSGDSELQDEAIQAVAHTYGVQATLDGLWEAILSSLIIPAVQDYRRSTAVIPTNTDLGRASVTKDWE
jgi:hypothetical protein